MARERLQIIIEAINESVDELNTLKGDLEEVDERSRGSASNMEKMQNTLRTMAVVAGTATTAFFAMKKAFDFAKEGAQLERTRLQFERLAGSIDVNAEILENELSFATQGLVSDMEAVELASQLMSLGLAKNRDEAVRLTKVASQLGMNMNQLVLTLTNQTTMRFDALGVAVDGFDEKVQKLEDSGIAANEAFKLAFIEQAEDQIERVGSVADTSAGEIMKLEAEWKNFTNSVKEDAAEVLVPVITAMNNHREQTDAVRDALERGILTEEEFNSVVSDSEQRMGDLSDAYTLLQQKRQQLNQTAQDTFRTLDLERMKYDQIAQAARGATVAVGGFADQQVTAQESRDLRLENFYNRMGGLR